MAFSLFIGVSDLEKRTTQQGHDVCCSDVAIRDASDSEVRPFGARPLATASANENAILQSVFSDEAFDLHENAGIPPGEAGTPEADDDFNDVFHRLSQLLFQYCFDMEHTIRILER